MTMISSKNDDDTTKQEEHDHCEERWIQYKCSVQEYWYNIMTNSNDPSLFALPIDYQYYLQCNSCPLPLSLIIMEQQRQQNVLPKLNIPLHVYTCRNTNTLECSFDNTSIINIINEMNELYWTKYSNIIFQCTADTIYDISLTSYEHYIQSIYDTKSNPRVRYEDSSDSVSHFHQYVRDAIINNTNNMKSKNNEVIRICFLDCIGNTLQGICLSSPKPITPMHNKYNNNDSISSIYSTTIIGNDKKIYPIILIGERSNKGYNNLTKRPHICLAKTLGHELGHALSLKHIRNQSFYNNNNNNVKHSSSSISSSSNKTTTTVPTTTIQQQQHQNINNNINMIPKNCSNLPNLMEGGQDQLGGGGYHLEQWQICMARDIAEYYYDCCSHG